MNALSILFLLIFFLILFLTYVIVRRGWLDLTTSAGLCAVMSIFTLIGFGLSREPALALVHAILAAVVIGLIFTGAIIVMASFFRVNEPGEAEKAYLSRNKPPSSN
ncbi:MAG: hypothetical protein KJ064_24620 [Anaerolineae bacterium]|jgi:uncharacterized protein YqfA (UPF0365 family)|nr:MAG: hypothetical protein F9K27_01225 [Anaerolineae bacterium]MCL4879863.1 hypothetical protein [Anaerolineae bacterium]